MNCKIHYILQPAIGWNDKKLTENELKLFNYDIERQGEVLKKLTSKSSYNDFKKFLTTTINQIPNIDFYDSNEWLKKDIDYKNDIFIDACHLTDYGNELLSEIILKKLKLND